MLDMNMMWTWVSVTWIRGLEKTSLLFSYEESKKVASPLTLPVEVHPGCCLLWLGLKDRLFHVSVAMTNVKMRSNVTACWMLCNVALTIEEPSVIIRSTIAGLLCAFWCQVLIWGVQTKETAWCYMKSVIVWWCKGKIRIGWLEEFLFQLSVVPWCLESERLAMRNKLFIMGFFSRAVKYFSSFGNGLACQAEFIIRGETLVGRYA